VSESPITVRGSDETNRQPPKRNGVLECERQVVDDDHDANESGMLGRLAGLFTR